LPELFIQANRRSKPIQFRGAFGNIVGELPQLL